MESSLTFLPFPLSLREIQGIGVRLKEKAQTCESFVCVAPEQILGQILTSLSK